MITFYFKTFPLTTGYLPEFDLLQSIIFFSNVFAIISLERELENQKMTAAAKISPLVG